MLITDDIYNDLSKRIMAGEFLGPEKDSKELSSYPAGADDDLFSSCMEQEKRKNATKRKTRNAKRKAATAQMKKRRMPFIRHKRKLPKDDFLWRRLCF